MQAVRHILLGTTLILTALFTSFELGGDKKTKGAALTFVRYTFHPARIILPTCFLSDWCTLFFYDVTSFCASCHIGLRDFIYCLLSSALRRIQPWRLIIKYTRWHNKSRE